MGKSKNKKVGTKKRPEDRHLRLKCKYKDCRKKIRSDKVQAHYRQHERIYLRNEKGEFQSKKATVRVTTLPSGSPHYRAGHQHFTVRVTTLSVRVTKICKKKPILWVLPVSTTRRYLSGTSIPNSTLILPWSKKRKDKRKYRKNQKRLRKISKIKEGPDINFKKTSPAITINFNCANTYSFFN